MPFATALDGIQLYYEEMTKYIPGLEMLMYMASLTREQSERSRQKELC